MSAQQEIIQKYGMPGTAYFNKWCVTWPIKEDFSWFPANRIFINKDFREKLYLAFKELENKGLQKEIKTFDGCYVERNVRGSSSISLHSWGMAIDLNASFEKLGQNITHFSKDFINVMTKYTFWGGNFKSRPDPMHFAFLNG
jgi:hypothetical protein